MRQSEAGLGRRGADLVLASAVFIALWKLGSLHIGKAIILPAPEAVLRSFLGFLSSPGFYRALSATAGRGLLAFSLAMAGGLGLGLLSGLSARFRTWLSPPMLVIRATPVLAIILLAMIWFPPGLVPVFAAVVMALPVVCAEVQAGVRSVDARLIEMAQLFRVSWWRTTIHIRLPAALPHIVAAAKNALGLSWKVVVAGEVLSQPRHAIGTSMQTARIMLETTEVLSWAMAGILLCALSDGLFNLLLAYFKRQRSQ